MSRKEELINLFNNKEQSIIVSELIDNAIFLEDKLKQLREMPLWDEKGKFQPAFSAYKIFMQNYGMVIRTLENIVRQNNKPANEKKEESPLRKFLNEYEEEE